MLACDEKKRFLLTLIDLKEEAYLPLFTCPGIVKGFISKKLLGVRKEKEIDEIKEELKIALDVFRQAENLCRLQK